MAEMDSPHYLADPRLEGGPDELRYIREQAEFYNALPQPFDLILVPACAFCASDQLREDRLHLALICERCGKANAGDVLRAGRLARR